MSARNISKLPADWCKLYKDIIRCMKHPKWSKMNHNFPASQLRFAVYVRKCQKRIWQSYDILWYSRIYSWFIQLGYKFERWHLTCQLLLYGAVWCGRPEPCSHPWCPSVREAPTAGWDFLAAPGPSKPSLFPPTLCLEGWANQTKVSLL